MQDEKTMAEAMSEQLEEEDLPTTVERLQAEMETLKSQFHSTPIEATVADTHTWRSFLTVEEGNLLDYIQAGLKTNVFPRTSEALLVQKLARLLDKR